MTLSARTAPAVALVGLIVVVLLASCTPGEPPAATVNGHDISAADLRADLKAEHAVAGKQNPAAAQQLLGQGEGTFKTDAASSRLTLRILDQVLAQDLRRRKTEVTAEDRTSGESLLCSSQQGCLDAYPKAYQSLLKEFGARYAAFIRVAGTPDVQPPPARSDAELEAAAREQFTQIEQQQADQLANGVCYQLVSAPDDATAQQLAAAVQGGADLAQAAQAVGGQVVPSQCVPAASEPEQLKPVAPGQAIVVTDQGQTLVVQVIKRGQIVYEDLRDGLVTQLRQQDQQSQQQSGQSAQQQAAQTALLALAKKADVTVDPRFGHWDPAQAQVVPPKVPKGVTPETTQAPAAPQGG